MLWHVLTRVQRAQNVDQVVVATSTKAADDAVAKFCQSQNFPVFRGSETDVLDRYLKAATQYRADDVVRITADCPLIDSGVIDRVVEEFLFTDCDYAANIVRRTYPHGLDTEVCKFSALATAWRDATQPAEREHVTPYLRESGRFKVHNVECEAPLPSGYYRWTVDEPADLEFVRAVYGYLGTAKPFDWRTVVALLEAYPALRQLNASVVHEAGYLQPSVNAQRRTARVAADVAPRGGQIDR